MTIAAANVLDLLKATIAADPILTGFVGDLLCDLGEDRVQPKSLPVNRLLPSFDARPPAAMQSLNRAIFAAAPSMHWQLSYNLDDGFSQDFLDRSGWFNLVAGRGAYAPYISDEIRIAIGYWDKGLYYPRHRHQPEEIYLVTAGSAHFRSASRPSREVAAGQLVHHTPFEPHSALMGISGLMAVAFWKGRGLLDKSEVLPEWDDGE